MDSLKSGYCRKDDKKATTAGSNLFLASSYLSQAFPPITNNN